MRCVCLASALAGSAPTRWVGESARAQLGVLLLEREQLAVHLVVRGVADRWAIEDVVGVRRALELFPECGGARRGVGRVGCVSLWLLHR